MPLSLCRVMWVCQVGDSEARFGLRDQKRAVGYYLRGSCMHTCTCCQHRDTWVHRGHTTVAPKHSHCEGISPSRGLQKQTPTRQPPSLHLTLYCCTACCLCRGLDNPRLLYSAETFHLQNRPLPIAHDMWAPPLGAFGGGGGVNSSFASSRDSFRQNWRSWVNHTRNGPSWLAKRLSPRNSTSPTSGADLFAGLVSARKGTGRSQSPTAAASGGSGLFNHAATAGGGFMEGPTGAVRSRSSLSVSTPPAAGSHNNSFARAPRGAISEAGRLAGLGPAALLAGGASDVGSSLGGTIRAGSYGRSSSPPQFLPSSHSETATAGSRGNMRGGFAAVLAAAGAAGPILIDAAGQSEDESSETPAAAGVQASQQAAQPSYRPGHAPWLLNSAGGTGSAGQGLLCPAAPPGCGNSSSSSPVCVQTMDPEGQGGPVGTGAAGISGQEQGQGLMDPYLGHVDLPPIHTAVAPGEGHACRAENLGMCAGIVSHDMALPTVDLCSIRQIGS
jgi:hypothetical protein